MLSKNILKNLPMILKNNPLQMILNILEWCFKLVPQIPRTVLKNSSPKTFLKIHEQLF